MPPDAADTIDDGGPLSGSRGEKSAGAFRTISEVSADLDVPQHVLRFWEGKFTQIRPMKRGGGRRYYRPDDVDLLRGICRLLYGDGYTIKGVQKILRENGVRFVIAAGQRPATKGARPRIEPWFDEERGEASRQTQEFKPAPPPAPVPAGPALSSAQMEQAARLLGRLKALKREHELRLQAARRGRV
jgi:DNA-binding transcriptional MerR regulator